MFWLVFFDRFKVVHGWGMADMVLLFAIITTGFGLAFVGCSATRMTLAEIIAQGRLDYYLALPRDVLLHVLASRSSLSAWGDLTFGVLAYRVHGPLQPARNRDVAGGVVVLRRGAGQLVRVVWLPELLAGQCVCNLATQASNAILTLALYPRDIFQGVVRFLMLTIIPAAFVGAIPLDIVRRLDWTALLGLVGFAIGITLLTAACLLRWIASVRVGQRAQCERVSRATNLLTRL